MISHYVPVGPGMSTMNQVEACTGVMGAACEKARALFNKQSKDFVCVDKLFDLSNV